MPEYKHTQKEENKKNKNRWKIQTKLSQKQKHK